MSRTTSSVEAEVAFQVRPPSSVCSSVPLLPAAQPRRRAGGLLGPGAALSSCCWPCQRKAQHDSRNSFCGGPKHCLPAETEDACEVEHVREAEHRLNLLQLVSGNNDLIAGNEISRVGGASLVDR